LLGLLSTAWRCVDKGAHRASQVLYGLLRGLTWKKSSGLDISVPATQEGPLSALLADQRLLPGAGHHAHLGPVLPKTPKPH